MEGAMNLRYRIPAVLLAFSGSALAGGWSHDADVSATVNGHSFRHVHVTAADCKLSFEILFDAPDKQYSDPKNKVRNYHLFQAKVQFAKGGQTVESKVFGNPAAGERVYRFEHDTGSSCWAKDKNTVAKLDVIGCRGRVCDLGSFQ
jgi:hypothetical protein